MKLIEKHLIKPNHKWFTEIDELALKSKNIYNSGLYLCRQAYFVGNKIPSYCELNQLLKNSEAYQSLPAKVAQQTLMLVERNFKSYFEARRDWKVNPDRYLGEPRLPKYKDKEKGRFTVIYTNQAISSKFLAKGVVNPSKTKIYLPTKLSNVKQLRIVISGNNYKLEVVYDKEEEATQSSNNKVAGLDLGLNNLATVVSNVARPLIVDGRALKSVNQQYNKVRAKLQSLLPKNKFYSRKLNALATNRSNRIDYYLHTASKYVIDFLVKHQITHLVIGKNKNWKQNINLSKRTNQNFVNVPHSRFIEQLQYKAQLVGIKTTITEENYTSKCSFYDLESIKKHSVYLGRRVKRGLFTSSTNFKYNADCNGAGNVRFVHSK